MLDTAIGSGMSVRPLKGIFGAEISGVDVTTAEKTTLDRIVELLGSKGAIVIRGQKLSPHDQVSFTRLFGQPAAGAGRQFALPEAPEVSVISNKVVDGRLIGDPDPGGRWHTDLPYAQRPAAYTFLHALEVPEEGSDTLLADTCAAWDALPIERQKQIDGLVIHHSYANLAAALNRPLTEEERQEFPDVRYPVVRRHPRDGRLALWGLSTRTTKEVVGMEGEAGFALIRELIDFVTQERFVYRHKWQPGDILAWDNRCTMHTGTPFDRSRYVRVVHRSWVEGEVPA